MNTQQTKIESLNAALRKVFIDHGVAAAWDTVLVNSSGSFDVKFTCDPKGDCAWPERSEVENIEALRKDLSEKHRLAEKAAHDLFAALPVGPDRTRAHNVFENIRYAMLQA